MCTVFSELTSKAGLSQVTFCSVDQIILFGDACHQDPGTTHTAFQHSKDSVALRVCVWLSCRLL